MAAALRVRHHSAPQAPQPAKDYLDRLIRLIPAEVVGLYLAGRAAIEAAYPQIDAAAGEGVIWLAWTLFCFASVFLVRAWATSDRSAGVGPQWGAVLIAAASFLVWVYSLGDGFSRWGLWSPLLASLMLLAWSFVVPFLYKGDKVATSAARAPAAPVSPGAPAAPANPGAPAAVPASPGAAAARSASKTFGPADAEACVLDCAHDLTNRQFSLSDLVSSGFDGATQVRRLMGNIQDQLAERFDINLDLASGGDDVMDEHSERTFRGLAIFLIEEAAEE